MIRPNDENYILKCRQLSHQYIVDMYAKNESESLLFIRLNKTKLRSDNTFICELQLEVTVIPLTLEN